MDHNSFRVTATTDTNLLHFFSYVHCNNTDLDVGTNFKGSCDFVFLNKSKMDAETWVLIGFLALIWVYTVSQDIEEAVVKERVLDHHIDHFKLSVPKFYFRGR